MNVTKRDKWTVIYHCYLAYFISGIVVLMFGVILPYLIEERGFSFTVAGGILSFLAVGNLVSCVAYPVLSKKLNEKLAAVVLAALYPVCLYLFVLDLPVAVLYLLVFFIGITKGMISIVNNYAVKQVTDNSAQYLTLLHMWYAVGALLSPFLFSVLVAAGISWKLVLKMLAVSTVLIVLAYLLLDFKRVQRNEPQKKEEPAGGQEPAEPMPERASGFRKDSCFFLAAGAMFCYMGLENAVNGWFVTYLENTGLMSTELSAMMVSVTWIMIMIGRIIVASVSRKVQAHLILAVITVVQFVSIVMLIQASSPIFVVISLMIMGLGMAGCYPTTTAFAGKSLGNSPVGMSVLNACGSVGGILVPQIIGILADHMGFHAAIMCLIFDGILLVLCGVLTIPASKRRN